MPEQPIVSHRARQDMIGRRFGRLTVTGRGRKPSGELAWSCSCDCGNTSFVRADVLKSGRVKSCGCLKRELFINRSINRNRTHGKAHTRVNEIWKKMRRRCQNRSDVSYERYGARGISVCERWQTFENFYADMGDPPTRKHSIDRINNEGNYEPENCRWATVLEQSNNKRSNTVLTFRGQSKTIAEWAREIGISPFRLSSRLAAGWGVKEALTSPVAKSTVIEARGLKLTVAEWAARLGMHIATIYCRLKYMTPEEAVTAPKHSGRPWKKNN